MKFAFIKVLHTRHCYQLPQWTALSFAWSYHLTLLRFYFHFFFLMNNKILYQSSCLCVCYFFAIRTSKGRKKCLDISIIFPNKLKARGDSLGPIIKKKKNHHLGLLSKEYFWKDMQYPWPRINSCKAKLNEYGCRLDWIGIWITLD